MSIRTIGIAMAVSAGVAAPAMAASVSFDFSGSDSTNYFLLPSSVTQSSGGVSVTADGKSIKDGTLSAAGTINGGNVQNARIGRYANGLGVVTFPDDSHQVDGGDGGWFSINQDEFIEFRFSSNVKLLSVNFDLVDGNDDFRWGYDSNANGSYGIGDWLSAETGIPGSTIFANFGGVTSSIFAVGAFGGNDDWKLRGMTVEYEVAPVPLPAAGLLLVGGLGALGAMRRRKSV